MSRGSSFASGSRPIDGTIYRRTVSVYDSTVRGRQVVATEPASHSSSQSPTVVRAVTGRMPCSASMSPRRTFSCTSRLVGAYTDRRRPSVA
jgi:hypothetical protein